MFVLCIKGALFILKIPAADADGRNFHRRRWYQMQECNGGCLWERSGFILVAFTILAMTIVAMKFQSYRDD